MRKFHLMNRFFCLETFVTALIFTLVSLFFDAIINFAGIAKWDGNNSATHSPYVENERRYNDHNKVEGVVN